MKATIILLIVSCLLLSCSNINRDNPVDKANLRGADYRLFQNTPAWKLAKAVQDEEIEKIERITSKNLGLINYQEPKYGNALLTLTIMNQQLKSFKALLERKANVSIRNTFDGTSAIIEACSSKHYDIVYAQTLVKYGANINDVESGERRQGNSTRETPLMAAAKTGKLDLVRFLISKGADVNYQNEFGQSALSVAVMLSRYEVSYYLLQNGANYKRPVFYRPNYSVPFEKQAPNDKGKPMYLPDVLKENVSDIDIDEYKYKERIIELLKSKGVSY
jgi:ankyrin repeat protein